MCCLPSPAGLRRLALLLRSTRAWCAAIAAHDAWESQLCTTQQSDIQARWHNGELSRNSCAAESGAMHTEEAAGPEIDACTIAAAGAAFESAIVFDSHQCRLQPWCSLSADQAPDLSSSRHCYCCVRDIHILCASQACGKRRMGVGRPPQSPSRHLQPRSGSRQRRRRNCQRRTRSRRRRCWSCRNSRGGRRCRRWTSTAASRTSAQPRLRLTRSALNLQAEIKFRWCSGRLHRELEIGSCGCCLYIGRNE